VQGVEPSDVVPLKLDDYFPASSRRKIGYADFYRSDSARSNRLQARVKASAASAPDAPGTLVGAASINFWMARASGVSSAVSAAPGAWPAATSRSIARVNGSPAPGVAGAACVFSAPVPAVFAASLATALASGLPFATGSWTVLGGVAFRPGFRLQASLKIQSAFQSRSLFSMFMTSFLLRQVAATFTQ
jgi:hypothetical protein